MNEIDVIKGAREILAAGHWHKGWLHDGDDCCIWEALKRAADWENMCWPNEFQAAADALTAHVPTRDLGSGSCHPNWKLVAFNDDPNTTLQDMLDLIDKTLADMGALLADMGAL